MMWPLSGSNSFIPSNRNGWRLCWPLIVRAPRHFGSRKSPRTWAPGVTCALNWVKLFLAAFHSGESFVRRPRARPRARPVRIGRSRSNWLLKLFKMARLSGGQATSKHQQPNTREVPNTKLQLTSHLVGDWELVFFWSLVVGAWRFLRSEERRVG